MPGGPATRDARTDISDPEKRLPRARGAVSAGPYRSYTPDGDINPESRVIYNPADTTDRHPPEAVVGEPITTNTDSDVRRRDRTPFPAAGGATVATASDQQGLDAWSKPAEVGRVLVRGS